MSTAIATRNFHVPLPDEIYSELRAEAERAQQPATLLARMAIEAWLEQRRAATLHAEIAAYAARYGGTPLDLDPDFEAAGLELWATLENIESEPRQPAKGKSRKTRAKKGRAK